MVGLAAVDYPLGALTSVALRAAAGALPPWLAARARGLLEPRAVAPAPVAANARVGAALWQGAMEALGVGGEEGAGAREGEGGHEEERQV